MKRTFLFALLLTQICVLSAQRALAGAEKSSGTPGRAVVAAVWGAGRANYSTDDSKTWRRLWPNKELTAGARIKTDGAAKVDLWVNGAIAVRLDKDSEISVDRMVQADASGRGDAPVRLNLKVGTLNGSAKKVSKRDSCEIAIPKGTVRTSGADFVVSVVESSPGVSEPDLYTCLAGSLNVEMMAAGGLPVAKVIQAGQSWNPRLIPHLVAGSEGFDADKALKRPRQEIDQLLLTIRRSSNPSINPPSFDVTGPIGPAPGEFILLPQSTQFPQFPPFRPPPSDPPPRPWPPVYVGP